jgi:hypothetical protein
MDISSGVPTAETAEKRRFLNENKKNGDGVAQNAIAK